MATGEEGGGRVGKKVYPTETIKLTTSQANRADATGNERDVALSRMRMSRTLLHIKTEAVVTDARGPKVHAQSQDVGMHPSCTLLSISFGLALGYTQSLGYTLLVCEGCLTHIYDMPTSLTRGT